MKRIVIYSLLTLVAVLLAGSIVVTRVDRTPQDNLTLLRSELKAFNLLDPEKDLQRNIRRKDFRFLAYCGYTCMVIGIEEEISSEPGKIEPLLKRCGSRNVSGTSDFIENQEYEYLSKIAADYIAHYNRLLLKHVIESGKNGS